jgi:hypothetical protein
MGTEVLIGLALSAAAAGAQAYNTRQTAKRQDNQLAAQIRADAAKQRQADEKTRALVQAQAKSSDADEKATALGKYTAAIRQAQGNADRPLQTVGNVSAAYKQAGSDAALGMGQYAGKIADLVSSIDAPTQQRENDKFITDRYVNDIDQISRAARGDDFLAQMKLRGIRRNPWIDAGASVLNGAGGAVASNAGAWDGAITDDGAVMGDYGGGLGTQPGLDAYNLYGLMPGYGYPGAGAPKPPAYSGGY